MKFKIPKGSDVYNSLVDLFSRGDKCIEAAKKLTKEFGAETSGKWGSSQNYFGGADGFRFEYGKNPDKTLWKVADKNNSRFFSPKANNKVAWEKIKALPVVTYDEINKAVGFPDGLQAVGDGMGISIIHTVGLAKGKNYFIMDVHDKIKLKPPKGVVEILGSEYDKLMKLIEKKEAA